MNKVIFKKYIRREEVVKNRKTLYVFGDNLMGIGFGGQAREMRGEYNTIGIPTKKSPSQYLRDEDYDETIPLIKMGFNKIERYLEKGNTVVIPSNGIGTGLARLPEKAPKIWKFVKNELEKLGWKHEKIDGRLQ